MLTYPTTLLTSNDSRIPAEFWTLKYAPSQLYVQGDPSRIELFLDLPERGLGIVGTRRAHLRSTAQIHQEVAKLRDSRIIIVSGLAAGIDRTAHLAAIENKIPTLAFLGTGLGVDYPVENRDLRRKILENGGLLISELEHTDCGFKNSFIMRNRFIAYFSKAVWVVEAPQRSGALNTAKWARDYGRHTFATPGFPGDPQLAGNQKLIDDAEAFPLWGAHNFGEAWLEYSSLNDKKVLSRRYLANSQLMLDPVSDMECLRFGVQSILAQEGCCSCEKLLEWAIAKDWSVERFFAGFEKSVELGLIREEGLFLRHS